MKNIYILVIALLTGFSAFAQSEIKGLITNQEGELLIGANVFVPEQNKGTVAV